MRKMLLPEGKIWLSAGEVAAYYGRLNKKCAPRIVRARREEPGGQDPRAGARHYTGAKQSSSSSKRSSIG
jgi:hypothetical protein